jgi:F420-dependent oxidoreductase-like protein
MLDVAIMIEGQDGLNWDRWQRFARIAEDGNFAGLYRSDHFTNPTGPHKDSLEMWASLTWLASNTSRIEFGPMVSPVSFRNPIVTAWTAAAVDDLSNGRLRLGLGAGWQDREHEAHGFDLLGVRERFDRFEEALQVITALLRSDTPSSFEGTYYQLKDALLLPRPAREGGPPIVIGGNGPKLTLPLAARFADEWNAVTTPPARFGELNQQLDSMLAEVGRRPDEVKRTMMLRVIVGRDKSELARKTEGIDVEGFKGRGALVGTPEEIVTGLKAFADAGASRVMAQWIDMDDIDGLELLGSEVLPALRQ